MTALCKGATLDGAALNATESVAAWFSWLETYGPPPDASLGLFALHGKWRSTSLLRVGGRYLQVHFEDVICEHCAQRCGLSATRQPANYLNMSFTDACKEFAPYPVLPCPRCGGLLRRRQTFWLANRQSS